VIGAGGLGHIGIQCLKAYTPTEIIVVDPNEKALALAKELGADHTVKVEGTSHIDTVQELTDGHGRRGDHRLRRREGRRSRTASR
jgi:NAD+-dependent secondary alcohol dehydrogenase Adh1